MDKNTLSQYGWVVIVIIVLIILIALATPFGSFVAKSVKSSVEAFDGKVGNMFNDANIDYEKPLFNANNDSNSGSATAQDISGLPQYTSATVQAPVLNGNTTAVPDEITNYTASQIAADDHLFAMGKNNPTYVVGRFNDDYTVLTITKNGADSDGVMMEYGYAPNPEPTLQEGDSWAQERYGIHYGPATFSENFNESTVPSIYPNFNLSSRKFFLYDAENRFMSYLIPAYEELRAEGYLDDSYNIASGHTEEEVAAVFDARLKEASNNHFSAAASADNPYGMTNRGKAYYTELDTNGIVTFMSPGIISVDVSDGYYISMKVICEYFNHFGGYMSPTMMAHAQLKEIDVAPGVQNLSRYSIAFVGFADNDNVLIKVPSGISIDNEAIAGSYVDIRTY